MQRFVYVLAKDHHTEDRDEIEQPSGPQGYGSAKRFQNATPSF